MRGCDANVPLVAEPSTGTFHALGPVISSHGKHHSLQREISLMILKSSTNCGSGLVYPPTDFKNLLAFLKEL